MTPFPDFRERNAEKPMVEPNLSSVGEEPALSRNTGRDVLAVRISPAERAQIATAAGLQDMPVSTYVRCVALQASAVAIGRASVVPRRDPARPKAPVTAPEPTREHYVDGELVRR
jgi:hypothetical protein